MNVVRIPTLRAIGFALIVIGVLAHDVAHGRLGGRTIGLLVAGFAGYCAVSWLILRRYFDGTRRFDLGVVFLALDLPMWTLAIYVTGATESWLYFLPLVRSADQTTTNPRRVAGFSVLGAVCYGAMVAYVALVENRPVRWAEEISKIVFLVGAGAYLATIARTATKLRRGSVEAIRVARASIDGLRAQSQQLEEARGRAEAANVAKNQFLASASHELRSPLNIILGYAELLRDELPADGTSARDDAGRILGAGRRLLGTVDQMLEFARLDAGPLADEGQSLDVDGLLDEVLDGVAPLADLHANTVSLVKPAPIGWVRVDRARLWRVLFNVLENATKFTRDGTVTMVAERDRDAVDWVRFEIGDTGVGVSSETLERIRRFEPFTLGDGGTQRQFAGAGLGLAIASRYCAAMAGDLRIESSPGAGATVTIRLPLPEVRGPDEHTTSGRPRAEETRGSGEA